MNFLGVAGHIVRFGSQQKVVSIIYDTVALYFNNVVNWYLFALLFAEILLYALFKANRYVLAGVSILCLAISFILPDNHWFNVISWILIAFSGITIGEIFERRVTLISQSVGVLGVAFLVTVIAAYYNRGVSIYGHEFGNPVWFILSSASGTILVLGISQKLEKYECAKVLKLIGVNSLYIMGLHLPVRNILVRTFGKFSESVVYNIIMFPLIIFIIVGAKTRLFINRERDRNETQRDSKESNYESS